MVYWEAVVLLEAPGERGHSSPQRSTTNGGTSIDRRHGSDAAVAGPTQTGCDRMGTGRVTVHGNKQQEEKTRDFTEGNKGNEEFRKSDS